MVGLYTWGGDSSLKSQPFLFTYIRRVHTSNIYIIQNYDDVYHYLQFSSTKQTVESYVLAPVVPHGATSLIIQAAPQPPMFKSLLDGSYYGHL